MWLFEKNYEADFNAFIATKPRATATQMEAYEARMDEAGGNAARVLTVSGRAATIRMYGVLTEAPDLMAMLFGGGNTTYADINAAIDAIEADESITSVELLGNSGGGQIAGMFGTMAKIKAMKTPITGVVEGLTASAAYGVMSQTDKIVAKARDSRIGSVGVVIETYTDENAVTITNSDSPKKHPDLSTEEGRAVQQAELNDIFDLFAEGIAEGRGVENSVVRKDFGQGGMFLAEKALSAGMIDEINTTSVTAVGGDTQQQEASMDLSTLKASYPSVFAEAVAIGESQEKKRTSAHINMGTACGDMDLAIEAIKSGAGMDIEQQSLYAAANMNKKDVEANVEGSNDAGDVLDNSVPVVKGDEELSFEEQIAANLNTQSEVF